MTIINVVQEQTSCYSPGISTPTEPIKSIRDIEILKQFIKIDRTTHHLELTSNNKLRIQKKGITAHANIINEIKDIKPKKFVNAAFKIIKKSLIDSEDAVKDFKSIEKFKSLVDSHFAAFKYKLASIRNEEYVSANNEIDSYLSIFNYKWEDICDAVKKLDNFLIDQALSGDKKELARKIILPRLLFEITSLDLQENLKLKFPMSYHNLSANTEELLLSLNPRVFRETLYPPEDPAMSRAIFDLRVIAKRLGQYFPSPGTPPKKQFSNYSEMEQMCDELITIPKSTADGLVKDLNKELKGEGKVSKERKLGKLAQEKLSELLSEQTRVFRLTPYYYRVFFNLPVNYHFLMALPHDAEKNKAVNPNYELFTSKAMWEERLKDSESVQAKWQASYNAYCRAIRDVIGETTLESMRDKRFINWIPFDTGPKEVRFPALDTLPT